MAPILCPRCLPECFESCLDLTCNMRIDNRGRSCTETTQGAAVQAPGSLWTEKHAIQRLASEFLWGNVSPRCARMTQSLQGELGLPGLQHLGLPVCVLWWNVLAKPMEVLQHAGQDWNHPLYHYLRIYIHMEIHVDTTSSMKGLEVVSPASPWFSSLHLGAPWNPGARCFTGFELPSEPRFWRIVDAAVVYLHRWLGCVCIYIQP